MLEIGVVLVLIVAAGTSANTAAGQRTLSLPPAVVPDTSYGRVDLDLDVLALDGSETTLMSHQDRVLLINFWATWCAPCRAEVPSLQALTEQLGDAAVDVLLISVDHEPAVVREFLEEGGIDGTVYIRNWQAGESPFRRAAIPTTYVIAKDGRITYRHTGAADWNTVGFAKYLRTLAAQE